MKRKEEINIKEKVEELVEFLYEKGMSQEGFLKVAKLQEDNKNYDVLDYCKKIYGLFGYIGLNDEQIEKFIVKNPGVFSKPKEELYKIAFVLREVDVIDQIFDSNSFVGRITNYKRLFMRDFISKKGGKYEHGKGISALVAHDADAYQRYHLQIAAYKTLGKGVNSDGELEYELNKVLLVNNEHITVEDYIDRRAKLFYMKYLRDTNFGRGSKDEDGKGSI